VSTALRNLYGGLFGIRPVFDGLALDPCLPGHWSRASVQFYYGGARVNVTYLRERTCTEARVTVDRQELVPAYRKPLGRRNCIVIPEAIFRSGVECDIVNTASDFPPQLQ